MQFIFQIMVFADKKETPFEKKKKKDVIRGQRLFIHDLT